VRADGKLFSVTPKVLEQALLPALTETTRRIKAALGIRI
jgi:hypothetical protein